MLDIVSYSKKFYRYGRWAPIASTAQKSFQRYHQRRRRVNRRSGHPVPLCNSATPDGVLARQNAPREVGGIGQPIARQSPGPATVSMGERGLRMSHLRITRRV